MRTKPLLVLGVLLAGCGAGAKRVDHAGGGAGTSPLADLEATSEQAYDRAVAGDTGAMAAASTRLLDDWTKVREDADMRGADDDMLDEIDQAVIAFSNTARASTDPVTLGRAANRITGSLDELFAVFDPNLRSDVMELDYLGRELALDGMASDMRHAATHQSLLQDRWMELRPLLGESKPAADLAIAVRATDEAVEAKDGAILRTRAEALVQRVYDLETALRAH
jgi:hypothetical protein